jgi:circadian clock protein KaiC
VLPMSAIELTKSASRERISMGIDDVDRMCAGGVYRDAVTLVSGATGTGKTLMGIAFVYEAVRANERSLLLSFEESAEQLYRNAGTWGIDLVGAVESGHVCVVSRYPDRMGLEDMFVEIKRDIEEVRPTRIVIDSISALTFGSSVRSHRELVGGLFSLVKEYELAAMLTTTTGSLLGLESLADVNISTMADVIVLLRYFEFEGQLRRAITIVKERASAHDHEIREYTVTSSGFHVGQSIQALEGLLLGSPTRAFPGV